MEKTRRGRQGTARKKIATRRPRKVVDRPDTWRSIQKRRPWRLFASAMLGGLFAYHVAMFIAWAHVPTQSELDVAASKMKRRPQPWNAPYQTDPTALAKVDMERVHADLLPAWIISLHHQPYTIGRHREEDTFTALRREVGKDPNLDNLIVDLRDKATSSILSYAGEIHELFRGWNSYLESNGMPFRVEINIASSARGGLLFTRSYRVMADLNVAANDRPERARVMSRIDRTNLGEMFLGQTSHDNKSAVVIADRIVEFSIDRLWPVLDEGAKPQTPTDRAFAPFLRAEAARSLSPEQMLVLSNTARARRQLVSRLDAIRFRRTCGRMVNFHPAPWRGLTPKMLTVVDHVAAINKERRCKRVTEEDAEVLRSTSEVLSSAEGLEDALGSLAAWLARAVTVHEVRHVADEHASSFRVRGRQCRGCPTTMGSTDRAEVSGYLASLATEGVGYVSLFQACGMDGAQGGPNANAVGFLLPQLTSGGCAGGPRADLYAHARALELDLFGRAEVIHIPEEFPSSLPLPQTPEISNPSHRIAIGYRAETPSEKPRRKSRLQALVP